MDADDSTTQTDSPPQRDPADDRGETLYESHHVPTHFGPRTVTKLTVIAALLMLALAIGFFLVHQHHSALDATLGAQTAAAAAKPPAVDVVAVKYASGTAPLTLPAETAGWYQSTVYARVNGYVAKWVADIGDRVTAGKELAEIETPELDAQLAAAKAKLTSAQAQVKVNEASVALAKSTYDRWWQSPKGVVSEQERQEKKAEYDASVAKLNAANAQVEISQADVNSLLAQTAFKQVKAPFDGVITSRKIDLGDLVTAGSTANTHYLYGIAQTDRIRVFADVPQAISVEITKGMPGVISTSEYPDRKFEGHVTRTADAIDPASRTLHVEVDVPNADLALKPGMYVQLSFELVQNSLLQVPASALVFRPWGQQVAVVGDDGKIHFQTVKIARDDGDVVLIASGISPRARVALDLPSQINDGDRITENEIEQPGPRGSPAPQKPVSQTTPVIAPSSGHRHRRNGGV